MKTYSYAIGDIHGRLDVLLRAIALIEHHRLSNNAQATVVFLGDYVDRGFQSKEVLDTLMRGPLTDNTKWICVQGNHEVMMLEGIYGGKSDKDFWLNYGGDETVKSFNGQITREYLVWLASLPKYYYDGKRVFVHAGTKDNVPLDQNPEGVLQWIRYPDDCEIVCAEGYVVHGHDPRHSPLINKTRCCIDVGAYKTGTVCVAVFDDSEEGGPITFLQSQMGYDLNA